MRVLNNAKARLLNLLDCAIWEDTFLFSIRKEALDGAIGEANLFRAIWEVLLDLVVLELEDLKPIWERCLRRLSFREEVDNLTTWESLLDVRILEKDDLIAIRPDLTLDSIWEHDLLLATLEELLFLALSADNLVDLNKTLISQV